MSRCRRRRRADALAAALAGLSPPAFAAEASPAATLVLEVTVNGVPAAEPVVVRDHDGVIYLRAEDVRALGLALPFSTPEVALSALPGVTATLDRAGQSLALVDRPAPVQRLGARTAAIPEPLTPSGWGVILDYDLSATAATGGRSAAALVDGVVSTPFGYGAAALVATTDGGVRRLDTAFTITDPVTMTRLVVGDFVNAATTASRPVRMAGVRIGTDFAIRPDLVTTPLPAIGGEATVASSVDLIVNGARREAGKVEAGRFAVMDVPVQAGVNTVSVAVRDALGRESRRTLSTYASHALLRPGLAAWSVEAGAVRTGYASRDDGYRAVAATASARYGLSPTVTVEGHAEVGPGVTVAGVGAAAALGEFGQVDLGLTGGEGVSLVAGFERIARPVTVAARYSVASRGWRDLAARYGSITRASSLVINFGFDLGRFGGVHANLIRLGQGRRADDRGADVPASTLASGGWSVRAWRGLSLVANGGGDLRRRGGAFATVGAFLAFGSRTNGFAGVSTRSGGLGAVIETSRAAISPGDLGWRFGASRGSVDRLAGAVEHQGRLGRYDLAVERVGSGAAARASARGAIVLGGDGVLLADRSRGSVAVVDAGAPGVPVFRENRLAGVTDRRGRLVIADLPPFEPTRLALDPVRLGDELLVDRADRVLRPSEGALVPVRFDVRRERALILHLVDRSGAPLPAGTRVVLKSGGTAPVGLDGMIYLAEDAAGPLTARLPGGRRCVVHPPAVERTGPVTDGGQATCHALVIAEAGERPDARLLQSR